MFQKSLVQGRFALLIISLCAALAWAVLPPGLTWLTGGGLLAAAVCVYLLTELCNGFVLLRINSRIMGSTLALMLLPAAMMHELQATHLILLCSIATYFPFFAIYQRPWATTYIYLAFLIISLSSLVFPQLLHFVPFCWIGMYLLRSFSLRGWVASLLGIVTPYCFFLTWAYCTDQMQLAGTYWVELMRIDRPDFSAWTLQHYALAALVLLHYLIGTVDLLRTARQDKTRTRYHYYTVLLNGTVAFLWLGLQPQHFLLIMPLCMTNAAILSGHFTALSYGRIQNIIVMLLTLLAVAIAFSYLWPLHC